MMKARSVAIVIGLCLVSASVSAAPPAKIAWGPCYRDFGPFECGTVQVPLDYGDHSLGTVSIAVVRLPAGDPSVRIGSLFVNPGGPGGSGVDFVVGLAPYLYTPQVRAQFDIVGFDPRGVVRSTALRCFGTPKQWGDAYTPFAFPMTLEEFAIWETADRYLDAACDQRGARIIDHMSTADVARDLDFLREAVGDDMLTYVGYSYGTYIGVTYANLFPGKVRALVIDGVLDPVAWSTGDPGESLIPVTTRLRSDAGGQVTLGEFFRLCDAGGANCAFAPASEQRYVTLAQELLAHPMIVTLPSGVTRLFTYADLVSSSLGPMYDSFTWPAFAELLAAIESSATPTVLGAKLQALWESLGFITKRGVPQYQNYIETWPAVLCADSDNPSAYDAWWNAAHLYDTYFGPLWTYYSSVCAAWPGTHNDRYTGPFTAWTANPVLILNTLFDPATRYENAVRVSELLPSSRLLTVHGWGHTTLFYSAAADAYVAGYLLTGALPDEGTVCDADVVPFEMAAAAVTPELAATHEKRQRATAPLVPELAKKLVR
jgi:pimeloyl-ACP methyl ester carboxylesterase